MEMSWFVSILILSALSDGYYCARSEFSKPNGKEGLVPALEKLVMGWGYPIESYQVTTEDKYILTVFRVPKTGSTKSPVFLQHGIHASGAHFLANANSLVFHLYKKGYDVWIGNSRGTQFSFDHDEFSPLEKKFWNFSFHEMGKFDLPAVIDYITEHTKKTKIHYVAHSMGTTMFLVMACIRPEKLDKINTVVFMAPVVRPQHMGIIESTFKKKVAEALVFTSDFLGYKSIRIPELYGRTVRYLCSGENIPPWRIKWCSSQLGDSDPELLDYENSLNSSWWLIDDSALKNHIHFHQIYEAGKFQQYDYGKVKNQEVYRGEETLPPPYDLKKIAKEINIIAGGRDTIASIKDINWLKEELSHANLFATGFEQFNHASFNTGNQIGKLKEKVYSLLESGEAGERPEGSLQEIPVEQWDSGERGNDPDKGSAQSESSISIE